MRPIDADELLKKAIPENKDAPFRCVALKDVINAPTVEPERKNGKWCFNTDGQLVCSNCYKIPTNRILHYGVLVFDMTPIQQKMRYCPNCGADMRVLKDLKESTKDGDAE